jgi:hypothetical protein
VVEQPSSNPESAPEYDENGGVKAEANGSFSAPGFSVLIATLGLLGIYIVRRK